MCSAQKELEKSVRMLDDGSNVLGNVEDSVLPDKDLSKVNSKKAASIFSPSQQDETSKAQNGTKQLDGLKHFQRSLDLLTLHAYSPCAASWLHYVTLNNWSHGLYYYTAGCAHLELYRIHKHGGTLPDFSTTPTSFTTASANAGKAEQNAKLATQYFTESPKHMGKKGLFARTMPEGPFNVFITRKLNKWQKRAKTLDMPLVDTVGPSPYEELVYFWGTYARMPPTQLEQSLRRLAWSDGDGDGNGSVEAGLVAHGAEDSFDDKAILVLLRAAALRQLGRTAEARALLQRGIVDKYRWAEFKTAVAGDEFGNTYPVPLARYELAASLWTERYEGVEESEGVVQDETGAKLNRAKLVECSKLLDEVARWVSDSLAVQRYIPRWANSTV